VRLSLVTVTHRSAAVLPRLLTSFSSEVERLGIEAQVVVVEQSEGLDQVSEQCLDLVDIVLGRPNRGYAAGVNAGVAASAGDTLLLVNPDIELLPGSLEPLLEALDGGWSVVGPQLAWDREGTVLLPVPEDPSPRAELWRAARRRWDWAWRRGLDGHLGLCWRLWRLEGVERVACLRGPLLALRRSQWDRLGPMDEGYFLYYEETEWLWRAHLGGARLGLVGRARVVHGFGHSTRSLEGREELERRSRQRFLARNYSRAARWALGGIASRHGVEPGLAHEVAGPHDVPPLAVDMWVLSPFAHLMPAAGWVGGEGLPPRVAELTARGAWFLAAASRRGDRWQLAGCWRWGPA